MQTLKKKKKWSQFANYTSNYVVSLWLFGWKETAAHTSHRKSVCLSDFLKGEGVVLLNGRYVYKLYRTTS